MKIDCTCACVPSCFSHVQLCVTLWTGALQAPLSMGFSRQEDWIGLPCLSLGHLPNSGIEPAFLTSPVLECGFFTTSTTWEARTGIPITQINSVNAWNNRSGFCFLHWILTGPELYKDWLLSLSQRPDEEGWRQCPFCTCGSGMATESSESVLLGDAGAGMQARPVGMQSPPS